MKAKGDAEMEMDTEIRSGVMENVSIIGSGETSINFIGWQTRKTKRHQRLPLMFYGRARMAAFFIVLFLRLVS